MVRSKFTRSNALAITGLGGALFGAGNEKVGKRVVTFSLPAAETCPGRTSTCEGTCYALRYRFQARTVTNAAARSLRASKLPEFETLALFELVRLQAKVVRVHVSGDMYSATYARKWLRIMRIMPHVRFYTYSRSWRIPKIKEVLDAMADLPNTRVLYSLDSETGVPSKVPPNVRLAYLQTEEDERIPKQADLVFRDHRLRRVKAIRVDGVIVCPLENGKSWAGSCEQCGLCIDSLADKDPRRMKRTRESSGKSNNTRIPLRLAA